MKIDIAKEDLWWIRSVIDHAVKDMESQPNPAAFSRMPEVGRKINRKINNEIKKAFGHDFCAWNYVK